jgi:hypothetical protein
VGADEMGSENVLSSSGLGVFHLAERLKSRSRSVGKGCLQFVVSGKQSC